MRESVPLRKESKRDGGTTVSFTCAMAKEIAKQGFRNGRESREIQILPLWKEAREAMPSRRSVERVRRKMLPLWKGPVRQYCLENL